MTNQVETFLKNVLIRNLVAFLNEADENDTPEIERLRMREIIDNLKNETASDDDWIEAIGYLDING